MNKIPGILAVAGLAALLAVAVACGNGEASTGPAAAPANATPEGVAATKPAPALAGASSEVAKGASGIEPGTVSLGAYAGSPALQAGIWVMGEGSLTLEPDLALLNLGVEATAKTVAEARDVQARAMEGIIGALHDRGVQDRDIQTRSFNVYPMYEYREVFEGGDSRGKQVLVGYTVSNTAAVKLRDLDAVGPTIDEVADAGGDATRINGISFTVEDTKPFVTSLREAAVKDALAKAQQFATLTGTSLGKLVFISETGEAIPVVQEFAAEAFALKAAAAPASPISGGELELRMSVQAVFEIQ